MRVKGTAYQARVKLLEVKLGEAECASFLSRYRAEHPGFPDRVLVTTRIPVEDFLAFNDAIVDRLYGGDEASLWELGEKSAEWSLQQGPYANLLSYEQIDRFAARAPVMWSNFFDTGRARSRTTPEAVELWIEGVPAEVRHVYFEYAVVGYFRRGMELLGAEVETTCLEGFSRGDAVVHYRLAHTIGG